MEQHLRAAIERTGYCIALEITSSVSSYSYKTLEAQWGKEYLEKLTRANVHSGLIFYRDAASEMTEGKVDYLAQLRGYEPAKSIQALNRITTRLHERDKKIAAFFADQIIDLGTKLEELIFSDPASWNDLRHKIKPVIRADSHKDYSNKISQIKGALVEEYTKLIFEELLPTAVKIHRYEYTHRNKGRNKGIDIDLILIDKPEHIHQALKNPRFFIDRTPDGDNRRTGSQRVRFAG